MKQRLTAWTLVFGLMLGLGLQPLVGSAQDPEPENSIKEVMVKAHKDGLLKKILAGDGTQEDKVKLLDLYIDMLEGTPKKGEQSAWIMAAGKTVVEAGKVVAGREGSLDGLKAATNCKACHDVFK